MNSSKRIGGRILSVVLAIMMVFSLMAVGFTANAASVPTTVYLKPGNWSQANAWFSAYFWRDSVSGTLYKMTDDDSDGIYEVAVPEGVDKVTFVRNDPAKTALSWSSKWNQSADENLPTDGTNLYTLPSNIKDKAAGTWGTYVPAKAPEAGDESSVQLAGDFTTWATSAITMVYAEDTNLVTTSVDLEAGTYEFKVIDGGTWKGNNNTSVNSFTDTVTDLPLAHYGSGDNVTLNATGGTYTFTYKLSADTISVAYTAPETTTKAPETTTKAPETTQASETTQAPETTTVVEPEVFDGFYWEEADGLYAYAGVVAEGSIPNDNAWQRWDSPNSNSYRYFYLPASAAADSVIIYNTFSNAVTVNGVEIPSKGISTVPYTDSQVLTVTGAESKATGIKIMKSDAEATLYINNADGMTLLYEDGSAYTGTNLYGFLTGGSKNREAGKLGGAVADSSGVSDAGVKKIKGRGNSTWNLAKKPFNITYSSSVSIDGMRAGKKWSLLANAQDPSLIRNRIVYDLANESGMKYACDSRFVDWFVNGDYKGSYQMTQKIEMGKGTVMPDLVEPEVENVIEADGTVTPPPTENFDFILELDTADNASSSGDLYFTTSRGQVMTFKTPDAPTAAQQSFIKAKYQAVEDALYGSKSLSTLEGLVDINDFARAYLVNEVAKNLDAGVTSCYFTYDSDAGKFYLSPVWDYDNAIGNSISISGRHDVNGNMLDLQKPDGWYVRDLAHYSLNTLNVFGQAVSLTSKNADGKTFLDIVKEVWAADFADLDEILEGTKTASGRLQTVDSYMNSLSKSGDWNYTYGGWTLSANNGWISDHSSLTMYDYDSTTGTLSQSTKSYDQYSLVGQANYASDWTISRINWLDAQFSTATPDPDPEPGTTKTVYVGVISYIS
ncbi:MAG: CotH kinase family protein, partial [Oscillospiraceae bacterium]|nr:CotH kinase family protein [Oscillospiraceae bacterium]